MNLPWPLPSAALLAALGAATPAAAFCRTRACDDMQPEYFCEKAGVNECPVTESRPLLFWRSSCMTFDFQELGSPKLGISYEIANELALRAFETWAAADCGGSGPSFEFADLGPVACDHQEFNRRGNANVFVFRDEEWPHEPNAVAVTVSTFDPRSGEIFDADMEINSAAMRFAASDPGPREYDLASVLTHEVGHLLGLAHSEALEATMWFDYGTGTDSAASLEADDVAGICSIYPPGEDASDACVPRGGWASECGGLPAPEQGCCSLAPGAAERAPAALLWLVACFALGARRRARRATDSC